MWDILHLDSRKKINFVILKLLKIICNGCDMFYIGQTLTKWIKMFNKDKLITDKYLKNIHNVSTLKI